MAAANVVYELLALLDRRAKQCARACEQRCRRRRMERPVISGLLGLCRHLAAQLPSRRGMVTSSMTVGVIAVVATPGDAATLTAWSDKVVAVTCTRVYP